MTNEELQQKVKRLEEEIINLKLKLEEKKPYEVEVPEDIGDYYFVSELGVITLLKDVFFSAGYEKVYQRGLAFKTKEEAEQFDKERVLINKLKNWAEEQNEGWYPNWEDCDDKFYIIYDHGLECFKVYADWRVNIFYKLPYFKSEEISQQFIEEFGDEIKEVLF